MLKDVSKVKMKTTIMGNEIDFPIGIAPTGLQKMAHPEGEVATARGIVTLGVAVIIDPFNSCLINEHMHSAKLLDH